MKTPSPSCSAWPRNLLRSSAFRRFGRVVPGNLFEATRRWQAHFPLPENQSLLAAAPTVDGQSKRLAGCLGTGLALGLTMSVVMQALGAETGFLRRSVSEIEVKSDDLSSPTARYKPIFGLGDRDAAVLKGIVRFGDVTVAPGGSTKIVNYPAEEQAYFVIKGSGLLQYGHETRAVRDNDFMYLPVTIAHGLSNSTDRPLQVLVMGYRIPSGKNVPLTPSLMMANANEVELQVLSGHGPTTKFRLLMGDTRSKRDKLAASQQISSLFIMDFAAGGTNIPHRHAREEEIYYVLRGRGEMVAGQTPSGQEARHACKAGDAFYFPPKTLVGFYSGAKEGEEHDLILAIRSPVPTTQSGN